MTGTTLALDAAAGAGTIAVLRDGVVLAERVVEMRSAAEERYFPAALETLAALGLGARDLDRVIAGAGPGSFTALRVVGAIAKGLCEGIGCPLIGVPSLALIPAASEATRGGGRFIATLDALRGDRYAALVVIDPGGEVSEVESLGVVAAAALPDRAAGLGARLVGPGEVIEAAPHARGVIRCASLLAAIGPADLSSWEPAYGRLAEAQVKWEAVHGRALVSERHAT